MNLAPGDAESMISTDDFQSEASLSPSGPVSSNPQAKNISMRNRLKWRTGAHTLLMAYLSFERLSSTHRRPSMPGTALGAGVLLE